MKPQRRPKPATTSTICPSKSTGRGGGRKRWPVTSSPRPVSRKSRCHGKPQILDAPFRRRRRGHTRRPVGRDQARPRRRDRRLSAKHPRPPFPRLACLGRRADIPRRKRRVRRRNRRTQSPPRRTCHCRRVSLPRYLMCGKRRRATRREKRTLDGICSYRSRDSTQIRFRGEFPISYLPGSWGRFAGHGRAGV